MAQMSPYVGAGSLSGNTTVSASKAALYAFVLPANINNLKSICQAAFDTPSNGAITCAPLDPIVMLLFDHVSWLGNPTARPIWTIVTPPLAGAQEAVRIAAFPGQGLIENEVLVQIPVKIINHTTGNSFLALFIPWIWVDNPLSLVAGREIYGYPKGPGIVTGFPQTTKYSSLTAIPTPTPLSEGAQPPSLALSVFGGNTTDFYWDYHPLITLTPIPLFAAPPQALSLAQWLQELQLVYPNTVPLLDNWSNLGATQVFLKQFPDISDAQSACFQQINSAQYKIQKIYSTQPFTWPMELTISPLDTDDLCLALGIPPTIPIAGGIQVVVDFLLTEGSVLWPSP